MRRRDAISGASLLLLGIVLAGCGPLERAGATQVSVTVPAARDTAFDGRLILLISADTTDSAEPRFQLRSERHRSAQAFGIDVEGWAAGEAAVFDASVFGFPLTSLAEVPAGTYRIQAVLNRYETFELSTGHTVKLPPDRGEGQQWNQKPGNL